jgi:hypothetical protein
LSERHAQGVHRGDQRRSLPERHPLPVDVQHGERAVPELTAFDESPAVGRLCSTIARRRIRSDRKRREGTRPGHSGEAESKP